MSADALSNLITQILVTIAAIVGVWNRLGQRKTNDKADTAAKNATYAADAAADAKRQAASAAHHATAASQNAVTAGDNSYQANESIEWLAKEIGKNLLAVRDLKQIVDDTVAANLHMKNTLREHGIPIPIAAATGPIVIPNDDPTEAFITGRHRLPTRSIPTVPTDTEDELDA